MCRIPLGNNQFAIVDEEDRDLIFASSWVLFSKGQIYSMTRMFDGKKQQLSRVIARRMGLNLSYEIDHKDRNKLNNRRSNLREATSEQNQANRGVHKRNKLGLKGVWFEKKINKYRAKICTNGKVTYLGCFFTVKEAKEAYDKAAEIQHKEFKCLN